MNPCERHDVRRQQDGRGGDDTDHRRTTQWHASQRHAEGRTDGCCQESRSNTEKGRVVQQSTLAAVQCHSAIRVAVGAERRSQEIDNRQHAADEQGRECDADHDRSAALSLPHANQCYRPRMDAKRFVTSSTRDAAFE